MIADIPSQYYQDFEHYVVVSLLWVFGVVFSGLVGYYFGRRSQKRARLEDDKLDFIPTIDDAIAMAQIYPTPNVVRLNKLPGLRKEYLRFRNHLRGKRLKVLNKAWEKLANTTEKEMMGNSQMGSFEPDDLRKTKQILVSRLEALRKAVTGA